MFVSQLESVWLCAFNITRLAELLYAKLDTGDFVDNVPVLVKNSQKLGNATYTLRCARPYRAKVVQYFVEARNITGGDEIRIGEESVNWTSS